MDAYPTRRTWPYLALIILLFAIAVCNPRWWPAGAGSEWDDPLTSRYADMRRFAAGRTFTTDPWWTTSSARQIELLVAPLEPPIADRVTVPPLPRFEADNDTNTANFDPSGVVELSPVVTGQSATSSPPSDNPIELELTLPDVENLATSLPELTAEEMDASELAVSAWPVTLTLTSLLDELDANVSQVAKWSNEIADQLNALQSAPRLIDAACGQNFAALRRLADEARQLEIYVAEPQRVLLRQIQYAIRRRVDIWQQAHALAIQQQGRPTSVNVIESLGILEDVEERLAQHTFAAAWRNYLMVEKLGRVASETWVSDPTVGRQTARIVLERMVADDLTEEQREFLDDPTFRDLTVQLEQWADQPIQVETFLQAIEQFEDSRAASIAERIVRDMQAMTYSQDPSANALRTACNKHYRNANVRFTVTGELLNDLLPVLEPMREQIRDNILGARVLGQNQTLTDLTLRLLDDDQRLRLSIKADGSSTSRTVSTKGPIRVSTRGRSKFSADKQLIVSPTGIFTTKAAAVANGNSKVLGIESDYDQIPLLGWIIRQMAMDELNGQKPRMRKVYRRRVRSSATKRLDESIHERLSNAEQRWDEAVLKPLRDLNLNPQAVELKTKADRLVMRFRLADENQLAAYTPRPRALAGNVLSLQLHESTANNLLDRLELEDLEVKLEDLMPKLTEKLGIEPADLSEDFPEDVVVHLGNERPIQFEFANDRVVVTVRIQRLTTRRRSWRNFAVRASYRADLGQTHIDLQRDGGIQMMSERLGFRDQVALRGIFTKVMARNHRLSILHGRVKESAQLNNLGVTQFVVRDGWIGISVGPRTAHRVASDPPSVAEPAGVLTTK